MTVKSIWLRRIHKWIGLIIGIQFLIWAISGAAMALLDMDEVAGGEMAEATASALPAGGLAWPRVQRAVGDRPVSNLTIRDLPQGPVFAVTTATGVKLFDAGDGKPVVIDRTAAASIASAAHPAGAAAARVRRLREITLAVRDHDPPIWQVDFGDAKLSSYYVSGTTGEILERRHETWRWWDLFWMLHNMDYANRTSFNHPLIITVGIAMAWLTVTGFWLLFRTMWRHDMGAIKRRFLRGDA